MLLDDSVRYAEKIANAGLSVSLNVWEGMPHGFQGIASLGAADASLKDICAFLQGCLSRGRTPRHKRSGSCFDPVYVA